MKINVHFLNDHVGSSTYIFECVYALSMHAKNNSGTDLVITYTEWQDDADVNVLFCWMPDEIPEAVMNRYDLVIFDNNNEPLQDATVFIKNNLNRENALFLTNSLLSQSHTLKNKVVPFCYTYRECKNWWPDHRFPQYYQHESYSKLCRDKDIIFINGQNRAHRHHFKSLLENALPEIKIICRLSDNVTKTKDSQWESKHDTQFRDFVNDFYRNDIQKNVDRYYSNSTNIGTNGQYGSIPPGYFFIPEYYTHHCIIYPETSWQNNETVFTEKTFKCFYSGSMPLIVGGAETHSIISDIGYYTAKDLLPSEHQKFDSELDHDKRYKMLIEAIKWLDQHPEIWHSEQCNLYRARNKKMLLDHTHDISLIKNFARIVGYDC